MEIKYNISLKHDDFVMLIEILKRAEEEGITAWDAAGFICENTKVKDLI